MKTDFIVLWIDDNKDFVDAFKPPLVSWMGDQGFGLIIEYRGSAKDIHSDLTNTNIELIVIDHRLGGEKNGAAVIEDIRSSECYQDIIFYTYGGAPNNLFVRAPDGVFFVDREDVAERIKDLIALRIKRATDLATVRGWTVADVIEIEFVLDRVLAKCFKEQETLFASRILDKKWLDFGKKYMMLSGILKDHIAALQQETPPSAQLSRTQSCKAILDRFESEIIEVRNTLAHQLADSDEAGIVTVRAISKNARSICITDEECVSIRKGIRKHMQNLIEIEKIIIGEAGETST